MINLLPPSQKEEIRQRKNLVFCLNIGISVLASLISFLILLSGIYFYLFENLKAQKVIVESKLRYLDFATEKEISEKNKTLDFVLNFEKKKEKFFPILEKTFEILPEGIRLESISVLKKEEEIEVLLTGFSPDRERLIFLRENLQKNFTKVFFPTHVWLKEREIDFSASFKTK